MKKRIILVSPLSEDIRGKENTKGIFYPPLGTLLVGSQLKKEEFDVTFIDGNFLDDYEERLISLLDNDVLFVGIYVTFLQLPSSIKLTNYIRKASPETKIIWGGPFSTVFNDLIFKERLVDIIVINDGAITTREVAIRLRDRLCLDNIRGIKYINQDGNSVYLGEGPKDNFNSICNIDYDLINIDDYCNKFDIYLERTRHTQIKRAIPILTGLGCSYKCSFCENALLNNWHRSKSASDIINEIKYLMKRYNIDSFSLFDEDFFIDKRRCLEFMDLIKKDNLSFCWGTQVRASYFNNNYISRDFVRRLEESGCIHLTIGAESGSQKVLDFINKRIKVDDLINSAKILENSSITLSYSFINFLPEEDMCDRLKSYKLIKKLTTIKNNSFVSAFHTYYPYPGTPLTQYAQQRYNFKFPDRLDEFSKIALNFEDSISKILPWYNKRDVKKNKIIYFYFYQLIYAKRQNVDNNFLQSRLRKILIKLSEFRCKNDLYIFPFEYYLVFVFKAIKKLNLKDVNFCHT